MLKKLLGYSLFAIINRIDLRLLVPPIGRYVETLRVKTLKLIGTTIGENSFIRAYSHIVFPANLTIGNHSRINNKASLYLFDRLTIGNNVEIGPDFLVFTGDHNINDAERPLAKQGTYNLPITIEDDVYIGARVTMLKGSYIEKRVVVAAGAVVSGRLKSGAIYGGVPAKEIKKL